MRPAIVLSAYNRPLALKRLLASIQNACYPPENGVQLVISIDRAEDGSDGEVFSLAKSFKWEHGEKRIIRPEKHLGLVEHFYRCGSLSQEYGAIILLEDDLFVSPVFYPYASQALETYQEERSVAGVSLYSLWFNGYTHDPFIPLLDSSDVYFLQIPYTQGQAFTGAQWTSFQNWMAVADQHVKPGDPIHEMFLHFKEDEWFPLRTKYLVDTGRYYVFPRRSLVTGFGDAGSHFTRPSRFFQVPLQMEQVQFHFLPFDRSDAVYDSFFEILPGRLNRLSGALKDYPYEVDLYATKPSSLLQADFVLSSRRSRSPLLTFGKQMRPMEANVIFQIPGSEIYFSKREDLDLGWFSEQKARKSNFEYFGHSHPIGRRQRMIIFLMRNVQLLSKK